MRELLVSWEGGDWAIHGQSGLWQTGTPGGRPPQGRPPPSSADVLSIWHYPGDIWKILEARLMRWQFLIYPACAAS